MNGRTTREIVKDEAIYNNPNKRLKEVSAIRIYEDDRIRDMENNIKEIRKKVNSISSVLARHCKIMEKQ